MAMELTSRVFAAQEASEVAHLVADHDPETPRTITLIPGDEAAAEANLKQFKRKIRKTPVLPIAAAFDEGIDKFKKAIRDAVQAATEE